MVSSIRHVVMSICHVVMSICHVVSNTCRVASSMGICHMVKIISLETEYRLFPPVTIFLDLLPRAGYFFNAFD